MKLINKIKKSIKKTSIGGLAALVFAGAGLTGCGEMKNPPGTGINGATTLPAGYSFSGETLNTKFKPAYAPTEKVEGAYQRPGEVWTDYQELTDEDNDGEYDLTISSASTENPGDYKTKFRTTCGLTSKESEEETIPVYANEALSDQWLEEALYEIGVDSTTTTKGEIKDIHMNTQYSGNPNHVPDTILEIRCRGPPFYNGHHGFIIQGSVGDTQIANQGTIDEFHSNLEGCIYILPIKTKNEIKQRVLQEKNSTDPRAWPDMINY